MALNMPPMSHPGADKQKGDDMAAFRMPDIIKKRSDFLAAAKSRRQSAPAFLLQGRDRGDDGPARVGFTCSKKIGNAVTRNRAKRRMREIARLCLPQHARPGWDYVLVGRPGVTVSRDFALLREDLTRALRKLHK